MIKLFIFCLALSALSFAQTITITVDGKKHSSITMEEIRKLKSNELEFFNHVTKRSEIYKGVPTLSLIEKLYPESQNVLEVNSFLKTTFDTMSR